MIDELSRLEAEKAEINGNMFLSYSQLSRSCEIDREIDLLVGPKDPRHRTMIKHFPEYNVLSVYWAYEYNVDLSRIKHPADVLEVLCHLAEKEWPGCTPQRLSAFAKKIYRIKGWDFYRFTHENEAPPACHDKAEEREKMTSQLRYQIIKRDGYRCRACGLAVQDGARLHVDHIVAVANGGKTKPDNLQTLCAACNIGKGAS
jgi:hypothetical protein